MSWHVSEYNLLSLLHEIINKEKYIPPEAEEPKQATLTGIYNYDIVATLLIMSIYIYNQ